MPESSRSTDASPSSALALAAAALEASPAGLLTDFDGTLSPIVADPALARLVDGADGALARLAERLAVVAIITGRAPLEARRLIGLPGLLVVGNHGTEWLDAGAGAPEGSAGGEDARALIGRALARFASVPEVVVQDKGLSATVHYRNARDPAAARAALIAVAASLPPGVELREGRMSVELRPIGLGDKGSAARAIVERHGLRGVVVMGDDVTDLDMFGAIAELRATGRVRAAIIAVGGADREVPASVAQAADASLADPAAAAGLLGTLAGLA